MTKSRPLREYTARLGDLVAVALRLLDARVCSHLRAGGRECSSSSSSGDGCNGAGVVTFTVLDLGCGHGVALRQLMRSLASAVEGRRATSRSPSSSSSFHKPHVSPPLEDVVVNLRAIGMNRHPAHDGLIRGGHRDPDPGFHLCTVHGDAGGRGGIPLPTDTVDLVISVACLPFILDKVRALDEIMRVLRPTGEARLRVNTTWKVGDLSAAPPFQISKNRLPGATSFGVGFVIAAAAGHGHNGAHDADGSSPSLCYRRFKSRSADYDGSNTVRLDEWLVDTFPPELDLAGRIVDRLPPRWAPEDRRMFFCPQLTPKRGSSCQAVGEAAAEKAKAKAMSPDAVVVRTYTPRLASGRGMFNKSFHVFRRLCQKTTEEEPLLQWQTSVACHHQSKPPSTSCGTKRKRGDDADSAIPPPLLPGVFGSRLVLLPDMCVTCAAGNTTYYRSVYRRR